MQKLIQRRLVVLATGTFLVFCWWTAIFYHTAFVQPLAPGLSADLVYFGFLVLLCFVCLWWLLRVCEPFWGCPRPYATTPCRPMLDTFSKTHPGYPPNPFQAEGDGR